jgi:thiamin-phosphate kinase
MPSAGKLEPELLKRLVFSYLGHSNSRVFLGPKIGEDATIIDFGTTSLVIHSDPITGAIENIGWLAVNIAANDIATCGAKPLWMLIVLLLPNNITSAQLKRITQQIDQAAKELDIAIVGGHTEVTPNIQRPILIATAIGEAKKDKLVHSGGAKIGDYVIITKGAAIEGTAILSTELAEKVKKKIDSQVVKNAQKFIEKISVVKDALTAMDVGGVHAMHDVTEGGVAAGLQEIAWASDVGVVAHEAKIPIYRETELICRVLKIDPLRTIGSGALLISACPAKAKEIVASLRKNGIPASVVGKIVAKNEGFYIQRKNGTKLDLSEPVKEELWRALRNRF